MSTEPITKDTLTDCLKDLAKEFRKLNGTKTPAELILIGGAAVLANYGFREMTYDIDAINQASSAMKQAINNVGDKRGLPNGWLNTDFTRTGSYSAKLFEVSVYYRTFSNILTVRTVAAEYLVAMKLMSGREYKYDLSDVAGILLEHQRRGTPLDRETVEKAVTTLYGADAVLPEASRTLLNAAFDGGDYETLYQQYRDSEKAAKSALVEFERDYPGKLTEQNTSAVLEAARKKKASLKERLEAGKAKAAENPPEPSSTRSKGEKSIDD